jgi:hypothetical protein
MILLAIIARTTGRWLVETARNPHPLTQKKKIRGGRYFYKHLRLLARIEHIQQKLVSPQVEQSLPHVIYYGDFSLL